MKKAVFVFGMASVFVIGVIAWAGQRTVTHNPVTTYTDGAPIAAGNAVTYSVWIQDNVTKVVTQIASRDPATTHTFDDAGFVKGRTYNFWAQTFLSTGNPSDNSAVFAWLFPQGKASPVEGGWAVSPPN